MRSAYNDAGSLQESFLRNPRLWESPPLWGLPPPLWGRVGEGGIAEQLMSGFPPPLTPPHKGEGNPRSGSPKAVRIAALRQAVARLETAALRGEVRHLP